MRTHAEAEELVNRNLNPLPYDQSIFNIMNQNYVLHYRNIPDILRRFCEREDLRDSLKYSFGLIRNKNGGNTLTKMIMHMIHTDFGVILSYAQIDYIQR
jgi:hypothetical protein